MWQNNMVWLRYCISYCVSECFLSKPSDQTHQPILIIICHCSPSACPAETIRHPPSPGCESQNLISGRSWKGISCWVPFTAALFGAQVWAHNFLSPLEAEQSYWYRTENLSSPPRFFALCRLKNPFHLLFIPPPQLQSHELSLHYAEMLRCWCFTETSSCDVSCSSIAQQISTKTPGSFSTVGWKFHRLAEIAAQPLPLVLKMAARQHCCDYVPPLCQSVHISGSFHKGYAHQKIKTLRRSVCSWRKATLFCFLKQKLTILCSLSVSAILN